MFVLPTLIYVLLGAAIAWASPAPNTPPTRHSTTLTSRARGIACLDGGLNCSGAYGKRAADALSGLDDNTWYNDSQLLACTAFEAQGVTPGGMCAYLGRTNGSTGQWIKVLAQAFEGHGCENCGQVPFFYPSTTINAGENDGAHGYLYFGYFPQVCQAALQNLGTGTVC